MVVMEDYISTQQNVVKSSLIVGKAIKMPKIKDLKTFTTDSEFDRIYDIQQDADVVARDNREANAAAPSNILNLSFRGPGPGRLPDDPRRDHRELPGVPGQAPTNRSATRTLELITQAKETLRTSSTADQRNTRIGGCEARICTSAQRQGSAASVAEATREI